MKYIGLVCVWAFLAACKPNDVKTICESGSAVEEIPWMKAEIEKIPDVGLLFVYRYKYKGDFFLSLVNPLSSSLGQSIYNCEGRSIASLNIKVEDFYTKAEQLESFMIERK